MWDLVNGACLQTVQRRTHYVNSNPVCLLLEPTTSTHRQRLFGAASGCQRAPCLVSLVPDTSTGPRTKIDFTAIAPPAPASQGDSASSSASCSSSSSASSSATAAATATKDVQHVAQRLELSVEGKFGCAAVDAHKLVSVTSGWM